MEDLEPLYLYILSRLPIKDLATFSRWHEIAGSYEAVYHSSNAQLLSLGWPEKLISLWDKVKTNFPLAKLFDSLAQTGVRTLPYYDSRYPKLLREIYDPPAVLFYRGRIQNSDEACIAIVGTRSITTYGRIAINHITQPLINSGCTVISGLAYGVDAAAHTEAIKQHKRTIAVLGSGVDEQSLYPRGHTKLADDIVSNNGLLLSEQPPGTPGYKQNFIARNRIIAGIALGSCIIECKTKSGALITADYAMDFSRPVYAVPGPVYSAQSAGPNELIKRGALLVTSGEDILQDLEIAIMPTIKENSNIPPMQKRVLECMQSIPATIDDISERIKLSPSEVMSALTLLELQGLVRPVGAEGFIKL